MSPDRYLGRLRCGVETCGTISVAVGVVALLGWFLRLRVLSGFSVEFIPMAPNTAVGFIVLGAGLWMLIGGGKWSGPGARVCSAFVFLLAALRVSEYIAEIDLGVDHWLFRFPSEKFGLAPVGRMALFTAITFLFAGGALLLLSFPARRRVADGMAAALAVVVTFVGLAFSLGYLYGKPLFYGGQTIPMALNSGISFLSLGAGLLGAVSMRDRVERTANQLRQNAQQAVTRVLAESSTLGEATPKILEAICVNLGWEWGALWIPDRDGKMLRCVEVWCEPGAAADELALLSRRTPLSQGEGLPGRVWLSGKSEGIAEPADEPNSPRIQAARRAGFHGAFAFPVLVQNEWMGVVECYSRSIRVPDEDLLPLMTALGRQIGQFMKRKQTEEILRENEERTRRIIETANDAFIAIDEQGVIADWNRQAEVIFGWLRGEALGKPMAETIIPARFREAHRNGLRRFLETGSGPILNRRIELAALHRDGRQFPIELTVWPIRVGQSYWFNAFVRDITARKKAEEELAAKTKAIQEDLQFAREFQEALMPREYPQVSGAEPAGELSLHFQHVYKPTLTMGGDFFDVFKLSEHRAGVFIADVMGHGVRSALVTALLRAMLQDLAPHASDPARFLTRINHHFIEITRRSNQFVFVTAFYLTLDTQRGIATFASAGHPSPLLAERGLRRVTPLVDQLKNNPALGLSHESAYTSHMTRIRKDDVFLLFTDGIIEAPNLDGEEFGRDRLCRVIEQNSDRDVSQLTQEIVNAVNRHIGAASLPDDICLVAVEVAESRPAGAAGPVAAVASV